MTTGSSSCRTTPNANGSSSSEPLASSGVIRSCPAAARAARASAVLPTPARSLNKEQRPFSGARAIKPFTQRLKLAFALDQNPSRDERHKPDDTRRAGA